MILVDSNVLIDVAQQASEWTAWSEAKLQDLVEHEELAINPVIFAEVSMGYARLEGVDAALPAARFQRLPLPFEAGFLAGKAFHAYRRAGGVRTSPLPDFFIGAHAAVAGLTLLTRDPRRFRRYFPKLRLIAP